MTPPTRQQKLHGQVVAAMSMADHDRFPSRKSPRMKQYDYSMPNYYFLTVCTWNKECLFGKPGVLSLYGAIAEQGIWEIKKHFPHVNVDKYVVMPNHIHMILVLQGEGADIPTVIGQYKSFVTRKIRETAPEQKVWQTSFHDHVIRSQNAYEKIWLYIEANPDNWGKDCFYQDR